MSERRARDPLLWRFCLYGFLKNQQYYEPFFLLLLQGKGLSFFQIGLLFSFREVCVNLVGVPAGFLADFYGRKSSLLVCFSAYIAAFAGFGIARSIPWLFLSMFAFAIGESFRSGTHKAMIFHHLRLTGLESQKSRIYGFTRSWSKLGSALSALASGAMVMAVGSYERVFLWGIVPYLLNMVNVGTYPKVLEGEIGKASRSVRDIFRSMIRETRHCLAHRQLRSLFFQSAILQAMGKSVRGYLQPLVVGSAVFLAIGGAITGSGGVRRSSMVLAVLYFGLNLLSALASRLSHRLDRLADSRFPFLWVGLLLVGASIVGGIRWEGSHAGASILALTGFVMMVVLENVWRPLLLDRLDDASDSRFGAAVLSVEAQMSSLGVMLAAPLIGRMADRFGLAGVGWCVAGVALAGGIGSLLSRGRRPGGA